MNFTAVQKGPIQFNQPFLLSNASSTILDQLKKINAGYFFFTSNSTLANELKDVSPTDLTQILNNYFMEIVEKECVSDPVQFLDRLATVIPLEKLQEVVKDDIIDALEKAKSMFEQAEIYLKSQEKVSSTLQARISSILDAMISTLDNIITAIGITDFFKPAENGMQAEFKFQKIFMLFTLFSALSASLIPLLGAATGGLVIGGIFLSIVVLSLIWPSIKPKPSTLPGNGENYSKNTKHGGFVSEVRKETRDEIYEILKRNKHVMLKGRSRVGKSLTAKAFAEAVERGDYPEFAGKVVIRLKTSDIIGRKTSSFMGGGNNILNEISKAMGRHRDDFILVLDEIHMACKHKEKLADQLKTFLDEGGEFPYVIGITTDEEYDTYVKENIAFCERFEIVEIKNTDEVETLKILGDTLLRSPSKPLIDKEVLTHIWNIASQDKKAPQPTTSLRLLKKCIHRTEKTQRSLTEKKIIEISNKILSLQTQAAASRGKKSIKEITTLKTEKDGLKEIANYEQKKLRELFKAKDLLDRVTKETYTTVLKISTLGQKALNAKDEKQLKLFLLFHQFLASSLEARIKTLETEIEKEGKVENLEDNQNQIHALSVKVIIDEALIDEVAKVK